MIKRLLPQPLLSLSLLLIWLLLVNQFSLGQFLLGLLLALTIPQLIRPMRGEQTRMVKLRKLPPFLLMLLRDIVVANIQVAIRIMGPTERLQPAFVEVPLQLRDPLGLTILASVICLTPGTVSADLSDDRKTLLVHGLDVPDSEALVAEIKQRYEAPLLEMFPCSNT